LLLSFFLLLCRAVDASDFELALAVDEVIGAAELEDFDSLRDL